MSRRYRRPLFGIVPNLHDSICVFDVIFFFVFNIAKAACKEEKIREGKKKKKMEKISKMRRKIEFI